MTKLITYYLISFTKSQFISNFLIKKFPSRTSKPKRMKGNTNPPQRDSLDGVFSRGHTVSLVSGSNVPVEVSWFDRFIDIERLFYGNQWPEGLNLTRCNTGVPLLWTRGQHGALIKVGVVCLRCLDRRQVAIGLCAEIIVVVVDVVVVVIVVVIV